MAALKVGDRLRLKADSVFTRSFPMGGYREDGDVNEYDKHRMRAGQLAAIAEVHDSGIPQANIWYLVKCEPPHSEVTLSLNEEQLAKQFEPLP
jgi:hypothetical protein